MASLVRCSCMSLVLSLGVCTLAANTAGNPYAGIASRNVFGLVTPQPPVRVPSPLPLAKVRVVGITTFAPKRALLDVRLPANPSEPGKKLPCILQTGQQAGPITVLEIDEAAGTVKVDNDGTIMVLRLAHAPDTPSPPEPPSLPNRTFRR